MFTLLVLVLLGPVWVTFLIVCVTYALAGWVFRGGHSRSERDSSLVRALSLAGSLVVEWLATAGVAYLSVFRRMRPGPLRRHLEAGRAPVALLPGYMENVASMGVLQRRLEDKLGVPVRTLRPLRYFATLENLGADYRLQIEALLKATGAKKVDLVGHSMGGLLARYLVEVAGFSDRVRSVVTLGAPHQGSALSVLGLGRNMRQMRRGSGFLERLNAGTGFRNVHFVGICSTHDNLVVPWNCALSPRGDNFTLRYRGHVTLIFSKEVVKLIVREIGMKE